MTAKPRKPLLDRLRRHRLKVACLLALAVYWCVVVDDVRIERRAPRIGVFIISDNLAHGCTYAPDVDGVHFTLERRVDPDSRYLVAYAIIGRKRCTWRFLGVEQLGL